MGCCCTGSTGLCGLIRDRVTWSTVRLTSLGARLAARPAVSATQCSIDRCELPTVLWVASCCCSNSQQPVIYCYYVLTCVVQLAPSLAWEYSINLVPSFPSHRAVRGPTWFSVETTLFGSSPSQARGPEGHPNALIIRTHSSMFKYPRVLKYLRTCPYGILAGLCCMLPFLLSPRASVDCWRHNEAHHSLED